MQLLRIILTWIGDWRYRRGFDERLVERCRRGDLR
jgi:hypothetical protein